MTTRLPNSLEKREAQIAILLRIKREVAPLCAVLESHNFRDRAKRIYNIADELIKDLREAK